MSERLLIALLAAALVVAARLVLVRRARRARPAPDLVAIVGGAALPTVVAFSAPRCAQCHFAQEPALERLHAAHPGRFAVRHVNVAEDPEPARRFRILTVPSTTVLASDGTVLAINHGLALEDRLARQLGFVSRDAGAPARV